MKEQFIPVSTIVAYNTKGDMKPIFFRYGEDCIQVTIKSKSDGIKNQEFTCRYIDKYTECEKEVVLVYNGFDNIWYIKIKHL